MRLDLLVRCLGTAGGTERYVHGFAAFARDHGHEVVVWTAEVQRPLEGVQTRLLGVRARGRAGRLRALDRAALEIPRALGGRLLGFVRAGRPDLYRAGGGSHRAWMQRHPRPWYDLDGRLGDHVEARLDERVLAQARRVVANSELARRELLELVGLPPERLALVRNGVDLGRFEPGPRRRGAQPVILFLANGWARKNLDTLLRALALLPAGRLVVAGRERRPERWARLARALGLADRVQWRGPTAAPEQLYAEADLYVLPTLYDPCANTCLEAMACGLPVLSTTSNGASELLPEGWMALEDPLDAAALAAAMARALQEPTLGEACRRAVEAWPAVRSYAELLREALALDPSDEAP